MMKKYRTNRSNIYYVYRLINPIDNQVFYIGSGKKNRVSQHWEHFLRHGFKSCCRNYDKYCILKAIKLAGLKPIEEILTKKNMTPKMAEKLESKYILQIGRICNKTGPLVNIKVYQTCPTRDNPQAVEKISKSLKKLYASLRGKEIRIKTSQTLKKFYATEEGKEVRRKAGEKISKTISNFTEDNPAVKTRFPKGIIPHNLGILSSPETRLKQSLKKRGRKLSRETRRRMSKSGGNSHPRIVYQFDIDGIFIREWKSIEYAARQLNLHAPNIGKVCLGHSHHTGGYIWEYKNP